ncbi:MAG: diguanylate cyclase [Desulfuromonadaceae bacterium]
MRRGDILIIDDNLDNLRVLEGILAAEGHQVRAAVSGEIALKAVAARAPELILLDVVMPEMDGFEICRRLKANPATSDIPVLFVSALAATEEKVSAFACGGLDYITKPFAEQEILARVQTHLLLATMQKELLRTNRELELEIEARQVAEAVSVEDSFRLFQIIQRVPVPTFVIDVNHVIIHWNRALENLTGFSAATMVGSNKHWRPFYTTARPTLADLMLSDALDEDLNRYYAGKYRRSELIHNAYEAEDFFRGYALEGKWLFFTASPLTDSSGSLIGAIETLQDITDKKLAERKLRESGQKYKELSITDALTQLNNSRYFFEELENEVMRAKRYGTTLSLLLLDVDNFKQYNDIYGHLEGDEVLKGLAEVIRKNLRSADTAARYGGEEFTLLFPETTGERVSVVAERLRNDFANLKFFPLPAAEVHMTISIGVSQYVPDETPSAFLKRADENMYKAKKQGKNRVCFE